MNILKTLVYAWQEDQVILPPFADRALVSDGAKLVLDLIERSRREEARQREEAARRVAEDRALHPERYKEESSSKRYSSRIPFDQAEFLESVRCHVPYGDRRPPNLKAATLSVSARLVKLVRERCGGRAPVAYKRAGIDRKLYSKIVSDDRAQISKKTALQLAIGLQLDRRAADEFLKAAGYSLSPTIPMDCVFAYCIDQRIWNILDVNGILVEVGLPALDLTV